MRLGGVDSTYIVSNPREFVAWVISFIRDYWPDMLLEGVEDDRAYRTFDELPEKYRNDFFIYRNLVQWHEIIRTGVTKRRENHLIQVIVQPDSVTLVAGPNTTKLFQRALNKP